MTPDPSILRDLLGVPFTDEQLAAASAPLEPAVVIAGAGSGKTTVMAARVVWLVVSGQVAPRAGPRPDLHQQGGRRAGQPDPGRLRKAALPAGPRPSHVPERIGAGGGDVDAEPTVATYHAYAGRLLREHGLWIGVEPSARLLADATRFQLAERALRRARARSPSSTRRCPTWSATSSSSTAS